MKVFGREPAFWVGLVEAALAVVLSFGLFHLSADQTAAIMAAVVAAFGLWTAYVTKDTMLGAGVGFAKAFLVLGAGFGLALTDAQTGALIALVTIVLGAWNRGKTSPAEVPGFVTRGTRVLADSKE